MEELKIKLEINDLKRILFLKSKIINSREDIIETGDIILTSLKREDFNEN